jgi:signal transduction histidine kinase
MHSLAQKLTLAFLLVGIVAVGIVGVLIRLGSENVIDRFVYNRSVVSLSATLASLYATTGSWVGIDKLIERNRGSATDVDLHKASIALVGDDRLVVYGQGEYRTGQKLTANALKGALPISVNGTVVGRLIVRGPAQPKTRLPDSPETLLLQSMGQIILLSALGAVALALALSAGLARSLAKPIRELTVATDAVARGKLGEQVPVRSQDELGRLAASFNHMSSDLARSTALRRQMTADVAHDLRTPLTLLLGYTEALHDGKFRGSQQTYAVMHDAAQQLQRLVDDLNMLALADAGELKLTRRAVAPQALLERTQRAFSAQAAKQQVALVVDVHGNIADIDVDADRLTQVLANLVANALRYTPAGGVVTLSAQAEQSDVLLLVSDTGSGIAPEHVPHIFDRFYRADSSRNTQGGEAGLGLAIARSIVEGHGGTIRVDSTVGLGTTFTIRLPGVAE